MFNKIFKVIITLLIFFCYIKKLVYNLSNGYKKVIDQANGDGTTIIDVEKDSTGFNFGDFNFKFYNTGFLDTDAKYDMLIVLQH